MWLIYNKNNKKDGWQKAALFKSLFYFNQYTTFQDLNK